MIQKAERCRSLYMVEHKAHFSQIHEVVRASLSRSAEMQQRGQIQGGLKMVEFSIGEKVWWYYPPSANQKLKYPWIGPYDIIDVAMNKNIVRIKDQKRDSWVHASSLKKVITTKDGELL